MVGQPDRAVVAVEERQPDYSGCDKTLAEQMDLSDEFRMAAVERRQADSPDRVVHSVERQDIVVAERPADY